MANLNLRPADEAVAPLGGAAAQARLLAKAIHLPVAAACVLVPRGRLPDDLEIPATLEVEYVGALPGNTQWEMTNWIESSDLLQRLRELRRPARVIAQVWTNEVVDLVERLRALGVQLDSDTTPSILGSSVRYWNTKIGGAELLLRMPEIADYVPKSTTATTLSEAISLASAFAHLSVLKVNGGAGGFGVVRLDPTGLPTAKELESCLTVSASTALKKTGDLSGPYFLQEMVGGPDAISPSIDFWIDSHVVECIGLAEQLLDDFAYQGARFPGSVSEPQADLCIALGSQIARVLSKLGYRGLLNIDFVVDHDSVWVIELNVRQSAPLDQSLRMTRRFGPSWRDAWAFLLMEETGLLSVEQRRAQ